MSPRPIGSRKLGRTGVAVTEIGEVLVGDGEARVLDQDGRPLAFARPSFSHF